MAALYPELAKEWQPTKNGDLTPDRVFPKGRLRAWWLCPKCEHEWSAAVANRAEGSGCPKCAKEVTKEHNLAALYPELAKEWHPTKNGDLTPDKVFPKSIVKRWWLCPECEHEWSAIVRNRADGKGCPKCAKGLTKEYNLAIKFPVIAKEWHPTKNENLTPFDVTPKSGKSVWWLCPKCGHEWEAVVANRTYNGTGCLSCTNLKPSKKHNLEAVAKPPISYKRAKSRMI